MWLLGQCLWQLATLMTEAPSILSWPAFRIEHTLGTALQGEVLSSALSRDRSRLALGSNAGELLVVGVPKLQVLAGPWRAHSNSVMDVSLNDDATSRVSVGDDGTLRSGALIHLANTT
jgi:hypothetical protein